MVASLQGNNIKAAGVIGPASLLLQEQAGGKHQPPLLAPVDTAEGAAKVRMPPVADFDEYYCIGVEHDQIKLATFASPIARQQLQALPLKVIKGLLFGSLAGAGRRRIGHQRGVSGRRLTWPPENSAHGSWRSMRWLAFMLRSPERPCTRLSGSAFN
ncbi:hypothetical protein PSPL106493_00250 [Pseudomonas plecoglossicida]